MDYETPRFESSAVAAACEMAASTFRGHFRRGNFRMVGDAVPAAGDGMAHLFSLRDALGFAVAAKLMRCGADPVPAFKAGVLLFAHTGSHDRAPAHLFDVREHGETLLVYFPDTGTAEIMASDEVRTLGDLLGRNASAQEAATVLVLNPLHARVCAALGVEG